MNSSISIFLKFIRLLTPRRKSGTNFIIVLHRIGDSVFTVPAIKGLFSNLNESEFTIICFPENKPIYNNVFKDVRVEIFESRDFLFGGRLASIDARRRIKKLNPYDIIDLTGTISSVSLYIGIKKNSVSGLSDPLWIGAFNNFSYKRKIPHLMDSYIDGVKSYPKVVRPIFNKEFDVNFKRDGIVYIHPFAGWKAKEWGIQNFIELAKKIELNYSVKFIFPFNESNQDFANLLREENLNFIMTKSIDELVELLSSISLIISNDSGPLYITSLLGKPTFSIYGPTNPFYSLPYGKFHKYIRKEIVCSPQSTQYCHTNAGLNCLTLECMKNLSVEEVFCSVIEFLNELSIIKRK